MAGGVQPPIPAKVVSLMEKLSSGTPGVVFSALAVSSVCLAVAYWQNQTGKPACVQLGL